MTTDDDIIINLTTDGNTVISSTTSDIISIRSLSDVERWMLGLMGVVVWINGIVGNILILVTLYCQPLLRSTHNIFLGNLALADLFIVGYGQPFWVVDVISGMHPTVNSWHCTINGYLGFVCSVASIVTLWTISCNRYLSICHHAIYQRLVNTKKRALQICLGLWIGSALFGSIPLFGPGSFEYESVTRTCFLKRRDPNSQTHIAITVCVLIIMVSIGFFNVSIFRTWWENKQRIGLWHSKSASNHSNLMDVKTQEYKIERPEEAEEQDISMKREHARSRTKKLVSMQKKVQVMKTDENVGQCHRKRTDEFMNNSVVQNNVMAEPQIIRKNMKSRYVSTGVQKKRIHRGQDHTRTQVCREKTSVESEDIPTNNNATDESEEQEEQLKGHGKSSECGRQFERKEHEKSLSVIGDLREGHTEMSVLRSGYQGIMVAGEQKCNDQKISTTSKQTLSNAVVISVCELVAPVANADEEMLDTCSEKAACNSCKQQIYSPSDEGILISGKQKISTFSDLITGDHILSPRTAKGMNTVSDKEVRPGNGQRRWNNEYQRTNITKKQEVITDSQKKINTIHEQMQTITSNQQSCSGLNEQKFVTNPHLERIPLGCLKKSSSQGQEGRTLYLKKGDLEEDRSIASVEQWEIMTRVQSKNNIENQVQDGIEVQKTNTKQKGAKDDEQRKRLMERNAKKNLEKQCNNAEEVKEPTWSCGEYSISNKDLKHTENVYHHCLDYRCRKIWHSDRCFEKLESGNVSGTRIKISRCLWEPKPEDKCEQTIGKDQLSRDEKQQEESMNQEQLENNQRPVKRVRLVQRQKVLTIDEQNEERVKRQTENKRVKPVQLFVEEISKETLDGREQKLESWDRQTNTFENLVKQEQEQQKIKCLSRMTQEQKEEKPVAKKQKRKRPIEASLAAKNKRFKWSFWHIDRTKKPVRQKEEGGGKQITLTVAVKPADISLMRSLLAVYVCLLLIYAAIVVVDIARAITYVPPTVTVTTNLLFFVNSSINWLLYGAFSYQFRLAYRRQLGQWTLLCCTCT